MEPEEMWRRYTDANGTVVRESLYERYRADRPEMNDAIWKSIEVGIAAPKVPWSGLFLFNYLERASQEVFYGTKSPAEALGDAVDDLERELQASS